jgi:hypothetical protein
MKKFTRVWSEAIESLYRHELFRPAKQPVLTVPAGRKAGSLVFYDWSMPIDAVQTYTSYVVNCINEGKPPEYDQESYLLNLMELTGAAMVTMDGRDYLLMPLTRDRRSRMFPGMEDDDDPQTEASEAPGAEVQL